MLELAAALQQIDLLHGTLGLELSFHLLWRKQQCFSELNVLGWPLHFGEILRFYFVDKSSII